jgi:hypothetical protein
MVDVEQLVKRNGAIVDSIEQALIYPRTGNPFGEYLGFLFQLRESCQFNDRCLYLIVKNLGNLLNGKLMQQKRTTTRRILHPVSRPNDTLELDVLLQSGHVSDLFKVSDDFLILEITDPATRAADRPVELAAYVLALARCPMNDLFFDAGAEIPYRCVDALTVITKGGLHPAFEARKGTNPGQFKDELGPIVEFCIVAPSCYVMVYLKKDDVGNIAIDRKVTSAGVPREYWKGRGYREALTIYEAMLEGLVPDGVGTKTTVVARESLKRGAEYAEYHGEERSRSVLRKPWDGKALENGKWVVWHD